jgi:hypothetical protein
MKRPDSKAIGRLDEPAPVICEPFVLRSQLLEKIAQFAPHFGILLEGPRLDLRALPLTKKTTDDLVQLLEFGWLVSEVATIWRVDWAQLSQWIESDGQRSSRARLARKAQAEIWDRIALAIGLFAASDKVEMTRAKLLMDHCRWRSCMYSPEDYVKRVAVKNTTENREARELTTAELQVIAQGDVLPGGL